MYIVQTARIASEQKGLSFLFDPRGSTFRESSCARASKGRQSALRLSFYLFLSFLLVCEIHLRIHAAYWRFTQRRKVAFKLIVDRYGRFRERRGNELVIRRELAGEANGWSYPRNEISEWEEDLGRGLINEWFIGRPRIVHLEYTLWRTYRRRRARFHGNFKFRA